jgi:hypothetical protein
LEVAVIETDEGIDTAGREADVRPARRKLRCDLYLDPARADLVPETLEPSRHTGAVGIQSIGEVIEEEPLADRRLMAAVPVARRNRRKASQNPDRNKPGGCEIDSHRRSLRR